MSSASVVKCVPISHKNVINGSQPRLSWLKKVYGPSRTSTISFVFSGSDGRPGLTSLACLATLLLTAGCYVFGAVPSSYLADTAENASRYSPSFWIWLFPRKQLPLLVSRGSSKASWKHLRMNRMRCVIKKKRVSWRRLGHSKCFGAGGASTIADCIGWAQASWSSSGPWTLIWQKSEVRFDSICWISIQVLIVWLFPQDRRYSI